LIIVRIVERREHIDYCKNSNNNDEDIKNKQAAAMPVNPGLGKGYVSPVVPLAPFDEWYIYTHAYIHSVQELLYAYT
jgi:hypothetical protein